MPAVVREAEDRDTLLLALVENVARENLSPVEEARAYATLIDEFELSLGMWPSVWAVPSPRLEPGPAARPSRGRPRARRARSADGGTRAGGAVGARSRATPPPRAPDRPQRHVRTGGRASGALGRSTCSAEDGESPGRPGADRRAREALARLTGADVRVGPGRLELALRGRDRAGRALRGARVRRGPAAARVLSQSGVSSSALDPLPADAGPTPGRTMHRVRAISSVG